MIQTAYVGSLVTILILHALVLINKERVDSVAVPLFTNSETAAVTPLRRV